MQRQIPWRWSLYVAGWITHGRKPPLLCCGSQALHLQIEIGTYLHHPRAGPKAEVMWIVGGSEAVQSQSPWTRRWGKKASGIRTITFRPGPTCGWSTHIADGKSMEPLTWFRSGVNSAEPPAASSPRSTRPATANAEGTRRHPMWWRGSVPSARQQARRRAVLPAWRCIRRGTRRAPPSVAGTATGVEGASAAASATA